MNGKFETISDVPTFGFQEHAPGMTIGQYRLEELLGRGGMGTVWKAVDMQGERLVALKLLPREFRGNADAMAQVRSAFHVSHALTHQNLCKVLALVDDPQHGPYIVMDFMPGITLSEYRRRCPGQKVPLEQVIQILMQVGDALDYAHQKIFQTPDGERTGVIHRDIKPQNIMINIDENNVIVDVSVIDMGLAAEIRSSATKFTQVRVDTRGTRPYMSPEQLTGKRSLWDGRTDQYSLAVVAYELLSGDTPFDADDDAVLMHAISNVEPDPVPDATPAVNAALAKALAKEKEHRFTSCSEFVQAFQSAESPKPRAWPRLDPQQILRQWLALEEAGGTASNRYLLEMLRSQEAYWQEPTDHNRSTVTFLQAMGEHDEERMQRLLPLAAQGDPYAQWCLGREYCFSDDASTHAQGITLLKAAAEQGIRMADFELALMREFDDEWATKTIADLAGQGIGAAMAWHGSQMILNTELPQSAGGPAPHKKQRMINKAIGMLQAAARSGSWFAASELESIFKRGQLVPHNSTESDYWDKVFKQNSGGELSTDWYGLKDLSDAGFNLPV